MTIAPSRGSAEPAPADADRTWSARHAAPGSPWRFLLLGTLGAAVLGAIASLGFSPASGPASMSVLLPALLGIGAIIVGLAVRRYELFVLVIVAIRAGIDGTRGGSAPATVLVAAVFVVFSLIWLWVQRSAQPRARAGLLSVASMCFVVAAGLSVLSSDEPSVSAQEWTRLLSAMLMVVVLERLFTTAPRSLPRMLVAAYVSMLAPLLVGIYQAITHRGLNFSDGLHRVRGTFAHPNSFAMYLAFLIVMGVALLWAVRGRLRWTLIAVLLVSLAMLYETQTRGSWIGAAAGILVVVGLRSRRLLAVVLVALALTALLPPVQSRFHDLGHKTKQSGAPGNSVIWRFDQWDSSLKLAETKPITGIGLKMVETESADGKLPHSDYVRSYVEGGVLGLVTYLGLLVAFAVTAVRSLRRARDGLPKAVARGFTGCTLALLLISASDNLITQSVVLWYFLLFAAAASAVARGWPYGTRDEAPAAHQEAVR